MKLLCTAGLIGLSFAVSAQQVIDVGKTDHLPVNAFYTVNGIAFSNIKYVRLTEGSPFFRDQWMRAEVVSAKGDRYKNLRAKLDLLTGDFIFLDGSERELVCTMPLKELGLKDTVSGALFHFVHSSSVPALAGAERGWYQPLSSGKAALYLFTDKIMQESKPYNAAVVEQRVVTRDVYLLWAGGTLSKVRKPRELIALLPDRKAALESFLSKEGTKGSTLSAEMTSLVQYYNSLQ